MKEVHEKVKEFQCNFCERSFSRNNVLKDHVKHVHEKERRPDKLSQHRNCRYCQELIKPGRMRHHIDANHLNEIEKNKEDGHFCKLCDKRLSTNANKTSHQKRNWRSPGTERQDLRQI